MVVGVPIPPLAGCYDNTVLQFATTVWYYSMIPRYATSAYYYNTRLQHTTDTKEVMLPHNSILLWYVLKLEFVFDGVFCLSHPSVVPSFFLTRGHTYITAGQGSRGQGRARQVREGRSKTRLLSSARSVSLLPRLNIVFYWATLPFRSSCSMCLRPSYSAYEPQEPREQAFSSPLVRFQSPFEVCRARSEGPLG